jgi:hypothetical protein
LAIGGVGTYIKYQKRLEEKNREAVIPEEELGHLHPGIREREARPTRRAHHRRWCSDQDYEKKRTEKEKLNYE